MTLAINTQLRTVDLMHFSQVCYHCDLTKLTRQMSVKKKATVDHNFIFFCILTGTLWRGEEIFSALNIDQEVAASPPSHSKLM